MVHTASVYVDGVVLDLVEGAHIEIINERGYEKSPVLSSQHGKCLRPRSDGCPVM